MSLILNLATVNLKKVITTLYFLEVLEIRIYNLQLGTMEQDISCCQGFKNNCLF